MKISVLLIAGLFLLASAAFAGVEETLLNNGDFAAGGAGWEFDGGVNFGAFMDHETTAWDPWPYPGASGYIRQIIDNSNSPYWDPDLNRKIETVEFDLYTQGVGYIQVAFDWWYDMGDVKPIGDADDWDWVIDDSTGEPVQFTSLNQWTRYTVDYEWLDMQPRWTSIEVYFFGCTDGNEAGVDSMVVTSMCIPEPSSLIAFSGSLLALAGFAWRRKH